MIDIRHAALGLACCAALWACGGISRPKGGPQTATEVLAAHRARNLPTTLQGEARMEAYVDGKARKADLLVRLQRPGRAQLQVMTPTGDMLAVLATDGARFTSFERGGAVCQQGPACAANMARLVPLALPPAELVDAVLGAPPLLDDPAPSLKWDQERGAFALVLRQGRQRQELWLRPPGMEPLASIVYQDGKRVASIAYGEHGKAGVPGLAAQIRVRLTRGDADVSIALREVEADAEIEPEAFVVACPSGMPSQELPCEEADATSAAPKPLPAPSTPPGDSAAPEGP